MRTITLNQLGWKIYGTAEVKDQNDEKVKVKIVPFTIYDTEELRPDTVSEFVDLGGFKCKQVLSIVLHTYYLYEHMLEVPAGKMFSSAPLLKTTNEKLKLI